MKNKVVLASAILIVVVPVAGLLVWNHFNYLSEIVHETARWAVIEDSKGVHMAVEPTSDEVWNQLSDLYKSKKAMWVGGIVEKYRNRWGFQFKPETIAVAEVTAEGLQADIRYISEYLDYWLNLGWVYVSAKVTEIHY